MVDTKLTYDEIHKISLGFNWMPDMSFDDFSLLNKKLSRSESYDIYESINERYILYKYELKN